MTGLELLVGLLPERLKNIVSSDSHLWKRNLLIMAFALFVSSVGMSAVMPFLPFYIRELHPSHLQDIQLWSGFIYAAPFLSAMIAVPIWGALGDKYGRKLMIVRANFGLTIVVLLMSFVQSPMELLLVRLLQGFISGYVAATLGFATANTPNDRTGFALAILSGAQNAGNILGPFFGGIITDFYSMRSVFTIVAIICFLATFFIIFFLKEKHFEKDNQKSVSVLSNLQFAFSRPQLVTILSMIAISQAGIFFANPIFALYVEQLNPPKEYLATITGILVAVIGFFSVITAPYWGKRNDKFPYHNTIIVAGLVSGITIIMHVAVSDVWQLLALRSITGLFLAAVVPTLFVAINQFVPIESKGGIMALASGASFLGNLLSYIVSGYTASLFGMDICFVISGILLIAVAIISYLSKRFNAQSALMP